VLQRALGRDDTALAEFKYEGVLRFADWKADRKLTRNPGVSCSGVVTNNRY